ncbi:hypothetical protein KDL29_16185 [bacterium]|nr:hypothetical protein [bacterium]UNM08582.1 MAG: hypothetical protein H7A35_00700 [Planctomycetales bacterium]
MKDATSIAIVFVICAVLLLLYFFVGQAALNRNNAVMAAELARLVEEERSINWMGSQITEYEGRLPDLKKRINYYKQSIPTQISDEQFFGHIARELSVHDVELLEIVQSGNRVWLGQLSKSDEERYEEQGLDINAIQQIRTSTFKIRVIGGFDNVLTVFENLKSSGRLYTIDQIISPAGGGRGTVLVNDNRTQAQMEITGSLYYGIPESYRDAEGLDKRYMEVAVIRNAQEISNMVKGGGREILHPGETMEDSAAGGDGEAGQEEAVEVDNSIQSGIPAGVAAFGGRG